MRVDSRQELSPCSLAMIAKCRHVDRAAKFVVAMSPPSPTQPTVAMIDTPSVTTGSAFFAPDRHHSHPIAHSGHPAQPSRPATQPTVAFFAHERTGSHRGSHMNAHPGHPAHPTAGSDITGSGRQPTQPAGVDDTSGTVSGLVPTRAPFQADSGVLRSTRGRTRRRDRLSRSYSAPWDKL